MTRPKDGETFECSECKGPMQKHDGPWDIWHCLPCNRSFDTWTTNPFPKIIKVRTEPIDPWASSRPGIQAAFEGK